ncbi:MAG: GGDEF domain-containing protein, partial [Rubrivivax sp.]
VWESWTVHGRLRLSMKRSRALEKMALRDPLTRVANRDGLNRALELLLQVQGDMSFPLSVVFVDADHFKRVNDEHGHEVGDQVLVLLARTLRANLPRDDLLARWGGEEFVIVMPQTPAEEAVAVAERLRQVLARVEWPAGLKVTASWGVAQAVTATDVDHALRAADQAMYRAKHEGRDRVISASA